MDTSTINADTELLAKFVNLPHNPTQAYWRYSENAEGEPEYLELNALLIFSEQDYELILQQSSEYDAPASAIFEKGFIDEVLPQVQLPPLKSVKEGEFYLLEGVTARKGDLFFSSGVSPLVNGSVYPLGNGAILINLYSH